MNLKVIGTLLFLPAFIYAGEFTADSNTLALFHFNEGSGTTFANAKGGSGSLFGSPTWVQGRFGNAIHFNGVQDYGNCNTPGPTNNCTYEMWFMLDSLPPISEQLWIGCMSYNSGAEIFPSIDSVALDEYVLNTNHYHFQVGNWYYIAMVVSDSQTLQGLYMNGVKVSSFTCGDKSRFNWTSVLLGVSSGYACTNLSHYFKGRIDEFRLSKIARSASEIAQYWAENISPAAPLLSSPTNGAVNVPVSNATFSWNTCNGATSYRVQLSNTSSFALVNDTTLSTTLRALSSLTSNALYYWRVYAANSSGNSAWSSVWSFTTVPPLPSAPVLATPSNGSTGMSLSPVLNWNASTGASSYRFQVSAISDFSSTILDQSSLSSTSITVSGLSNSATYYWRANAANIGGTGLWSSAWSFTTIIAPPFAPSLTLPSNNVSNQPISLVLSWTTVGTASSYGLQLSTDSNFGSTVFGQTGLTLPSQGVSGLSNSVTYYWRANAANIGGTGAWSGAWSFSTCNMMVIPLSAAWNMKSLNIRPFNDSPYAVFGSDSGFLFVKNIAGNQYCPALNEDQIVHVQVGQGYQIYTNVPDTIKVQGTLIDISATRIALSSGWNMVAYLPQIGDSAWHAMSVISNSIVIVKNNSGTAFWPALGIDDIGMMVPGEGYKMCMSSAASLLYPTPLVLSRRLVGSGGKLLHVPATHHYKVHSNTGTNATLLAKRVTSGGELVPNGCEIGAFDAKGEVIGSGTVINGVAAFPVWGDDPMTKQKDGAATLEAVTFKLWENGREYPLDFYSGDNKSIAIYEDDALLLGTLYVSTVFLISKYDLSRVYPNPFRGFARIAFDIPTINNISEHNIDIAIYDMKGSLISQLAKGRYKVGHYSLVWNSGSGQRIGSSIYIVRMKAENFEKRLKLIRLK